MGPGQEGPPAVVAIVGPTATGKSEVALNVAEHLGGEIVGVDALQLYRGMDIGTAKVPIGQRRGIAHYQLDVLDVREEASVAAYQRHARADVGRIEGRGRRVVAVGGSGLYVRALLDDIAFPGTDAAVRARLEARAQVEGPGMLHAELARLDPAAAAAIHSANARRVIRALEVIELTGRPYSATLPVPAYVRPAVQVGLMAPMEVLDERIGLRVEQMVEQGLVAEVEALAARGLREGKTASKATGYSQVLAYLDGQCTLEEAKEDIKLATRQLARRQRKWFRRDPRIEWIDVTEVDPTGATIQALVRLGA